MFKTIVLGLRLGLIRDLGRVHKFLSVQVAALSGALVAAWQFVPDDWKQALPADTRTYIAYVGFAAVVLARMIRQDNAHEHDA